MKQKFKLVVPEDLLDYVNDRIKAINNKIVGVKYGHDYNDDQDSVVICLFKDVEKELTEVYARVKKEWLQEIKQPMTCTECFIKEAKEYNITPSPSDIGFDIAKKFFTSGWSLAIENEKLKQEMKENNDGLPENVEEIEGSPVSDEQIIIDWLDNPDQLNKQMIVWKDDLLALINRAKQNDRKITQIIIDEAWFLVKKYDQEKEPGPSWEKIVSALQRLKEQDGNRSD